jgi:DNA-binding transcriptional ArsR family regulator
MTAGRGGAPSSDDDRSAEGTGQRPFNTASDGPVYDMGAAWHRYKGVPPVLGEETAYWAPVSERLVFHPLLTGRVRHTRLAVDVWCALYITLMAGRYHAPYGEVDPCRVAAALNVSDRTVRRALETLEEMGAVIERRRVGEGGNLIWVRLNADRYAITR